jgi:hypothetical protein
MASFDHVNIRSGQYKTNLQTSVDQGGKNTSILSPSEASPSKANQGQTTGRSRSWEKQTQTMSWDNHSQVSLSRRIPMDTLQSGARQVARGRFPSYLQDNQVDCIRQ